jgi:hypothetical protein
MAEHTIHKKIKNNAYEHIFILSTLVVYISLSFVKMRSYLTDGRFWAEEASGYYTGIQGLSFFEGLSFIFHGHLSLATNLVVSLSTLFDFKYAPLVTTYGSFLLQSIPVIVLLFYRESFGLKQWGAIGFVLILVGLPQSAEVWANSTNLHFHFSFLAAIIAIMEIGTNYPKTLFRIMLALSGLSGIPANFLAPVFLALAITTQQKERWVQFYIIASTTIVQLILLLFNSEDMGNRGFPLNPVLYWLSITSQQVISPLLGFEIGNRITEIFRGVLDKNINSLILSLICSVPIFYFLRNTSSSPSRPLKVLAISAFSLSVLSIAFSLDGTVALISAAGGGRYFFASNALIALYLLNVAGSSKNYLLRFFVIILIVSSVIRVPHYLGGPGWGLEYLNAVINKTEHVNIWPNGWKIKNFSLM